jgi:hypothetical protein
MLVPNLPANVVQLRTGITAAVAEVTPEMLRSVWQETERIFSLDTYELD